MERVVPQIFGGGQHHHHQGALRQLLRHVVGTVQAVPFAFSIVAALVTVPVGEVVLAVLVIQGTGQGQTKQKVVRSKRTLHTPEDPWVPSLVALGIISLEQTFCECACQTHMAQHWHQSIRPEGTIPASPDRCMGVSLSTPINLP